MNIKENAKQALNEIAYLLNPDMHLEMTEKEVKKKIAFYEKSVEEYFKYSDFGKKFYESVYDTYEDYYYYNSIKESKGESAAKKFKFENFINNEKPILEIAINNGYYISDITPTPEDPNQLELDTFYGHLVDTYQGKKEISQECLDAVLQENETISLKDCRISEAKLENSQGKIKDFRGAVLSDCNLKNYNFENADFTGCSFYNTRLDDSNFRNANFENAIFRNGYAKNCNLEHANFQNVHIDGTRFEGNKTHDVQHFNTVTITQGGAATREEVVRLEESIRLKASIRKEFGQTPERENEMMPQQNLIETVLKNMQEMQETIQEMSKELSSLRQQLDEKSHKVSKNLKANSHESHKEDRNSVKGKLTQMKDRVKENDSENRKLPEKRLEACIE